MPSKPLQAPLTGGLPQPKPFIAPLKPVEEKKPSVVPQAASGDATPQPAPKKILGFEPLTQVTGRLEVQLGSRIAALQAHGAAGSTAGAVSERATQGP